MSSVAAPSTANRTACPASSAGTTIMPRPPAALAADPANRYGISRCASCQAGTAVLQISAAVYVQTAGPMRAAPAVAAAPAFGSRPVTAQAAAAPDAPPNAEITHVPTLIGEVTLTTRSMFRKRSGRPRSATRATPDSPMAPTAAILAALACR